ncbi:MAG: isopentenyl-diphosphate Delta-isomerase [Flammeovirgaceae bacterium]|jgi:isopentenyl-diphosphate delta-isomerase|nr:isopentenyl-diphosphate Delta-isomerase [Flammeovirgaceae bacterium]
MEQVILVNEKDEEIGFMEKLEAHQKGLLHRAFSILIFNTKGEMLIHQRAKTKYHSGELWTNACCSHPKAGETIEAAGHRKLLQEMGISCHLTYSHKFIYRIELDNGLTEYEWDHVLIGSYDADPICNPEEVQAWKYQSLEIIKADATKHPDRYTSWFKIILQQPELSKSLNP